MPKILTTSVLRGMLVGATVAVAVLLWWRFDHSQWQRLEVTASAYNSTPDQTTAVDPDIAAWGDRLEPGMRVIAISRDLEKLGIGHGTRIRIDGLPGEWVVLDRMNRRWKNRIDIYMGIDVDAARQWGKRDVTMHWRRQHRPSR